MHGHPRNGFWKDFEKALFFSYISLIILWVSIQFSIFLIEQANGMLTPNVGINVFWSHAGQWTGAGARRITPSSGFSVITSAYFWHRRYNVPSTGISTMIEIPKFCPKIMSLLLIISFLCNMHGWSIVFVRICLCTAIPQF